MSTVEWHVPEEELRRYADRMLGPPLLWSVETHLASCGSCRARLTAAVDPRVVTAGWERLDAELDAPVPGPVERLVRWCGAGDHTARLLAATPVLRLSWLASVTVTLVLTAAIARAADPWVFFAVVPVLPLIGVAVSFGPGVDPTYELSVVAPMHTFRLLLLRSAAVLATTAALSAAAVLALPALGLTALSWFLPALALTLLTLTLAARLGPAPAAGVVGLGWLILVTSTREAGAGGSVAATGALQLAAILTAALAAVVLVRLRSAFDTPRGGTTLLERRSS